MLSIQNNPSDMMLRTVIKLDCFDASEMIYSVELIKLYSKNFDPSR